MAPGRRGAAGCRQAGRAIRREWYVRQVEVVAQLWDRSARTKDDRTAILAEVITWGVNPREARGMVRHAELFQRKNIRDAAREGVLSVQHLNVLDETIAQAPEPDRDKVEAALLENAAQFDGTAFTVIGRHVLQLLDQDGKEPDDPELAAPTREFHLASRKDGSVVFRGLLDQESGAKLAAMIR